MLQGRRGDAGVRPRPRGCGPPSCGGGGGGGWLRGGEVGGGGVGTAAAQPSRNVRFTKSNTDIFWVLFRSRKISTFLTKMTEGGRERQRNKTLNLPF